MDQAEGFYRQALTLKSTNSHARFRLGAIYAQRGQTVEARREYALGLETDPFNAAARAALEKLRGP
jgi:Flp pilus assembly protein TadD